MKLSKIILPLLISIVIIIGDYKFSVFVKFKNIFDLLLTPIWSLINTPYSIYQDINNTSSLENNKLLQQEILVLKSELQGYNALLLENKKLTKIINSSYKIINKKIILAKIINISLSRLKKQIVIDKGSDNGLKINQIVLGAEGVIGRIADVKSKYSSVNLITDPLQYIPVINSRSGERGITKGLALNKDKMMIKFVHSDADIKLGDIFLTSGNANLFTNSYPIGIVSEFIKNNNDFMTVILDPVQKINSSIFVVIDISND